MTWNYRIIRKTKRNPIKKGKPATLHFYDLHEVHYDKKGKPVGWTVEPILGGFESMKDLRNSLAMMLVDSIKHPAMEIKTVGGKPMLIARTTHDR